MTGVKDCEVCGNEIPNTATICRFCSSTVTVQVLRGSPARMCVINVKAGRPTVPEGLDRLKVELDRARHSGARLVRVIHGYGSSGVGGELRIACRSFLVREERHRRIKKVVDGENYSPTDPVGRALIQRHAGLKRTGREDRGNPGITFVEL